MLRTNLASMTMAIILASLGASSAGAVTNIRFERWGIPNAIRRDVVAPVESSTAVGVYFEATVTPGDLSSGMRFAIAERDPGGNDVLARFELQPCAPVPSLGEDVAISASVNLYCDKNGELRVRDTGRWTATWCELPQQRLCSPDIQSPPALPSTSEPESWEFVVLGDGDIEGSFPTPDDVTACGTPTGPITEYVAPEFAQAGSIGLFADPGGLVCSAHVQPGEPFTWYIVADLDGMTLCGVKLVEFGITPLPPGFFVNIIPNPHATFANGSPFTQAGLGFNCERGDGERLVLYTIQGVSTQAVEDFALAAGAAAPPSNQYWPYPWTELCPRPGNGRHRMRTSTFYINPAPEHDCDTPVPAIPTSWTAMKSLYGS